MDHSKGREGRLMVGYMQSEVALRCSNSLQITICSRPFLRALTTNYYKKLECNVFNGLSGVICSNL